MDFTNFEEAYDNAIQAIIELREKAEEIRDRMDGIVDACETIEGEL